MSLNTLSEDLSSKDTKTRFAAINEIYDLLSKKGVLAQTKPPAKRNLIDALRTRFKDNNAKVVQRAAECLRVILRATELDMRLTEDLLPEIVERLGDNKTQVRDAFVQVFLTIVSTVGGPRAVGLLDVHLPHKNWRVREQLFLVMAEALRQSPAQCTESRIPKVVQGLNDSSDRVREASMRCLDEYYKAQGHEFIKVLHRYEIRSAHMSQLQERFMNMKPVDAHQGDGIDTTPYSADESPSMPKSPKSPLSVPSRNSDDIAGGDALQVPRPRKKTPVTSARSQLKITPPERKHADDHPHAEPVAMVVPVNFASARDVTKDLEKIALGLKNAKTDWNVRIEHLRRLQQVSLGNAPTFDCFSSIVNQKLKESLTVHIQDLRSQVCKEACATLITLIQVLNDAGEGLALQAIPVAAKMTSVAIHVIADAGVQCLRALVTNCQTQRVLAKLLDVLPNRNITLCLRATECIQEALDIYPLAVLDRHVDLLEETIKKMLEHGSSDVRVVARRAFKSFSMVYEERSARALMRFDPNIQRSLAQEESDKLPRVRPLPTPTGRRPNKLGLDAAHKRTASGGPAHAARAKNLAVSSKMQYSTPSGSSREGLIVDDALSGTPPASTVDTASTNAASSTQLPRSSRTVTTTAGAHSVPARTVDESPRGNSSRPHYAGPQHGLFSPTPEPLDPSPTFLKTPLCAVAALKNKERRGTLQGRAKDAARGGRRVVAEGGSSGGYGDSTEHMPPAEGGRRAGAIDCQADQSATESSTGDLRHGAMDCQADRGATERSSEGPRHGGSAMESQRPVVGETTGALSSGAKLSRKDKLGKLNERLQKQGEDSGYCPPLRREHAEKTSTSSWEKGPSATALSGGDTKPSVSSTDLPSAGGGLAQHGEHRLNGAGRNEEDAQDTNHSSEESWTQEIVFLQKLTHLCESGDFAMRESGCRSLRDWFLIHDASQVTQEQGNVSFVALIGNLGDPCLPVTEAALNALNQMLTSNSSLGRDHMSLLVSKLVALQADERMSPATTSPMNATHASAHGSTRDALSKCISTVVRTQPCVLIVPFLINIYRRGDSAQDHGLTHSPSISIASLRQAVLSVLDTHVLQDTRARDYFATPRTTGAQPPMVEIMELFVGTTEPGGDLDSSYGDQDGSAARRVANTLHAFFLLDASTFLQGAALWDMASKKRLCALLSALIPDLATTLMYINPDDHVEDVDSSATHCQAPLLDSLGATATSPTSLQSGARRNGTRRADSSFAGTSAPPLAQGGFSNGYHRINSAPNYAIGGGSASTAPVTSLSAVLVHGTSKPALLALSRIASDDTQDWHKHFGRVLVMVLDALAMADVRDVALLCLQELVIHRRHFFADFAAVVACKLFEAHKNAEPDKLAQAAIDRALGKLVDVLDPVRAMDIIAPVINRGETPPLQAAIRLMSSVLARMGREKVKSLVMTTVLPGIVRAFHDVNADVRKSVVFFLVDLYLVLGDEIMPYLKDLSPSQLKLVTIYIGRAKQGKREVPMVNAKNQ